MLVNLNYPIKNIEDVDTGKSAALCLAELLSVKAEGIDTIKAWDWALKLKAEGQIEIDRTDCELLESAIKKSQLFVFAAAPLLLTLKEAREKA